MFRFGDSSIMSLRISIPAVRALSDPEQSLAAAPQVPLDHSWPPAARPAGTTVQLAWDPGCLFVRAVMEDEEITTSATEDSLNMCKLGDVFEIFLEAKDAGFYTEMHVAPGNHRLHLRLGYDDFASMQKKMLALESAMIRPPQFESRCALRPGGWTVDVRIPAGLVDPKGQIAPDSQWNASFCRYDAWSNGRSPVLSSTSAHEQVNFHLRQDWRPICF